MVLCVAIAPIGDLEAGYQRRLSDEGDAIPNYMQCAPSDRVDCPYKQASPHRLLPVKTPLLVAVGTADADVPPDMVAEFYAKVVTCNDDSSRASSGSVSNSSSYSGDNTNGTATDSTQSQLRTAYSPFAAVQFLSIPHADHFQVMTANDPAWEKIFAASIDMLST